MNGPLISIVYVIAIMIILIALKYRRALLNINEIADMIEYFVNVISSIAMSSALVITIVRIAWYIIKRRW